MSNAEVCSVLDNSVFVDNVTGKNYRLVEDPDTKEQKKLEVRHSKIRKGIQRTLNTAKFEQIVIYDEIEEVIEWTTPQERQKKINNWDTVLVKQFKKTHDEILAELNLSHKQAYFVNNLEKHEPKIDLIVSQELNNLDELE